MVSIYETAENVGGQNLACVESGTVQNMSALVGLDEAGNLSIAGILRACYRWRLEAEYKADRPV
jgi:hypothetical protein